MIQTDWNYKKKPCPKCLDWFSAGNLRIQLLVTDEIFSSKEAESLSVYQHTGWEEWLEVISRQVDVFFLLFTSIKLCRCVCFGFSSFTFLWLELSMIFRVTVIGYNQGTLHLQVWCLGTRRYPAPASVTAAYPEGTSKLHKLFWEMEIRWPWGVCSSEHWQPEDCSDTQQDSGKHTSASGFKGDCDVN